MKVTEIIYRIEDADFTSVVKETKGLEYLYNQDILARITGILSARDKDGKQVAVIVGINESEV